MAVKFKNLLKENYYKALSTIFLATGFSLSSYAGLYVKNIIFNDAIESTNLNLCLLLLALGIMFIVAAVFFSLKIDLTKGKKKYES